MQLLLGKVTQMTKAYKRTPIRLQIFRSKQPLLFLGRHSDQGRILTIYDSRVHAYITRSQIWEQNYLEICILEMNSFQ